VGSDGKERFGWRRGQRVLVLSVLLPAALLAWGFLGRLHVRSSSPVRIGSNSHGYTVANFRVISPFRALTEAFDFMPHSRPWAFGAEYGTRSHLCLDGERIERLRRTPAAASIRGDGALYAFLPDTEEPEVVVVRVADGRRRTFELPDWGLLRWDGDARVVVWRRDESGEQATVATVEVPPDLLP
jgi:hypothetical protein